MKAIACIWVVGMWYNIIAYRTLCAYLPLHRLWIWWAFCTGIAAAIVSIARAAANFEESARFCDTVTGGVLSSTTLTSYRRHSKNFSMQPCYAFLQEGRKYFKVLRRLGG